MCYWLLLYQQSEQGIICWFDTVSLGHARFITMAFEKLRKATIKLCHVCLSAWNNSPPQLDKFPWNFMFQKFFENLSRKHQVPVQYELTRMKGTLQEYLCKLMIFPSILLRMRSVSDKVVEKTKTHILCSIAFPWKSCCLWDNVEKKRKTLCLVEFPP